jgi:Ca2+ transporting ATPase
MSIIVQYEGKRRLFIKGASEMVLKGCTKFLDKNTMTERPIDPALKETMEKAISSMAQKALRTIVMAYKDLTINEDLSTKNQQGVYTVEEKDLVCCAILGIADVLREEVPKAIA